MVCFLCMAMTASSMLANENMQKKQSGAYHKTPLPWYVTAAAMHRMMLKPPGKFYLHEQLSLNLTKATEQLRALQAEGIDTLDVYAPEEGGTSYGGLDAKNRYALDPGIGTVEDLRHVIREAHALHMDVISSQNLGYAALDAPQFIKAEDDVRAGRSTRETKFFFWSKSADAPPPETGNSYFLIRPSLPGGKGEKTQFWQWRERAQAYFWTRWPGKDANGSAAWPRTDVEYCVAASV